MIYFWFFSKLVVYVHTYSILHELDNLFAELILELDTLFHGLPVPTNISQGIAPIDWRLVRNKAPRKNDKQVCIHCLLHHLLDLKLNFHRSPQRLFLLCHFPNDDCARVDLLDNSHTAVHLVSNLRQWPKRRSWKDLPMNVQRLLHMCSLRTFRLLAKMFCTPPTRG